MFRLRELPKVKEEKFYVSVFLNIITISIFISIPGTMHFHYQQFSIWDDNHLVQKFLNACNMLNICTKGGLLTYNE